mmetsp:Transcript_102777/g.219818  ORF Transcript_102777/g.219818 Transcript_102777/m.219818 type:complete len:1208 (+) Transcript_102777:28-3651(+)
MPNLLTIRMEIEEAGFTILKDETTVLTEERAKDFYRDYKSEPFYGSMVKEACVGPCCVMALCRLEAVEVLQQLMGPESVKDAKRLRSGSIRARFGRDGQRNAVHGSKSAKTAAREVRFFFPQMMGADPVPDDDEVRDFLFRKTAKASMDLKSLSDADSTDFTVDPTMQQLLSRGLHALCQVQPKGLAAVKWLSRWLFENNPNQVPEGLAKTFDPPERTKRFVEYGINPDGMPFAVEAPPPVPQKKVIEVDVSQEVEAVRVSELSTPPFVIFVTGGPGSGKGTQVAKIAKEFNFIHLCVDSLMNAEVAACTHLGTEIEKHQLNGTEVPDKVQLQLLKKTMEKHQDTNRFLLDGFPKNVKQAKDFEQEIAEVSFILHFDADKQSQLERLLKGPDGAMQGDADAVGKQLELSDAEMLPFVEYYAPIGKVRKVNASCEKDAEEVYKEARKYFCCRFLYLLGPPGAPVAPIASRLEEKYGFSSIDLMPLLKAYAASEGKDAEAVRQALAKGKPVDASIACPLVLMEIRRDMALGVQNFVICDFPQSLKQAQFLEYSVPCCTSMPLLLEFNLADAEDLAAPLMMGNDAPEVEMRTSAFFAAEMQETLKSLPGLTRIPCSLAELDGIEAAGSQSLSLEEQLAETIWPKVCEKVMPGVTLVLGLPGSGTDVLANILAKRMPNTQAVDCNLLLDRELERRTETAITMHNMLARGQVVPLSTTLELLKDIVNLTSSDFLVLENCPMYVDQIEYLSKEFRIDRVFYIAGNADAVAGWKDSFVRASKSDDPSREARAFEERQERLDPIVSYFSKLGKLERMDVGGTPNAQDFATWTSKAVLPQIVTVCGPSNDVTPKVAAELASKYGADLITVEKVMEVAKTMGDDQFAALQQVMMMCKSPVVVMDRFPSDASAVGMFEEAYGMPAVVVTIPCDDDYLEEEYKDAHEGEAPPEEDTEIKVRKAGFTEVCETWAEKGAPFLKIDSLKAEARPIKTEPIVSAAKKSLLPKVYIVVGPAGMSDFSNLVASSICAPKSGKTSKYTVIDSSKCFAKGGRSAALEDKLAKASFAASAPDCVQDSLWLELFAEAIATSANPMGTFLVTNFPTPSCLTNGPTIRDQFSMLESISTFAGIIHLKLSDLAFSDACSRVPEDAEMYAMFEEKVQQSILVQYGGSIICECHVDNATDPDQAAAKVATQFMSFREKSEQAAAAASAGEAPKA